VGEVRGWRVYRTHQQCLTAVGCPASQVIANAAVVGVERTRLCAEVHLNLAYRWFCRLDLTGRVPDHSTFSKNRHGRFRESDLLRHVFEATVRGEA